MATAQQGWDWMKVHYGLGSQQLGLKPEMTVEEYEEKYPESMDFAGYPGSKH